MAPLLPKLRGHFAEFLRESYLAPLSILNLPTCVGLGYGYYVENLGFLGYMILTYICATQADILTSASSTSAYANASTYNRTLPYRLIY